MALQALISRGYTDVSPLGSGAFGSVFQCTSPSSNQRLAVKVSMDERGRIAASREAEMMSLLPPHPNVLSMSSFEETEECTVMALPLATGGDTLKLMQERGLAALPEADARGLFAQLVAAVSHMHSNGVVHRDIKCENVLLNGARRRQVLLADFGFSARYKAGVKGLNEPWGSLHYSSPEIVLESSYEGPEVDVWSMGVVLYAWCTGRLPFGGASEDHTARYIVSGTFHIPSSFSPELASLISSMLTVDPNQRITLSSIASHPWLSRPSAVVVHRHASSGSVIIPPRKEQEEKQQQAPTLQERKQRRHSIGRFERPNKATQFLRKIFGHK